jgi:hypothetical protein
MSTPHDEWHRLTQDVPFVREIRRLLTEEEALRLRDHRAAHQDKSFSLYGDVSCPEWVQGAVEKNLRDVFAKFPPLKLDMITLTDTRNNVGHDWHYDSCRHEDGRWVPNHTPWRVLSMSVALSDPKDYEGGAIAFKDPEESHRLRPGEGVVFTSNHRNHHKVDAVSKGRRYVLLLWYRVGDPAVASGSVAKPRGAAVEKPRDHLLSALSLGVGALLSVLLMLFLLVAVRRLRR